MVDTAQGEVRKEHVKGDGRGERGRKGEERRGLEAREKPELDILGVGVLIRVSRSSRISRTGRREEGQGGRREVGQADGEGDASDRRQANGTGVAGSLTAA